MTELELKEIEDRCKNATKGPWKSMIEGRDHTSGDSFIMTGGEDIYISNPLFDNNQDFIANAKQDIPKLIAEIKRLKMKTE
ncbi:hypothetical protein [Flavobacterium sp. N2270]|uniref:hypothetical protein n=1 Tax=Flavobacterium sp. N2270 TaxID=2986831 RepID=UPI00222403C3|nr:hypothetical protein [Flavobacterium sp. N2270]